jgi:predicted ATPase
VFLLLKVRTYARLGHVAEGLRILAEVQAFIEETGEKQEEAELYRLKGELMLQADGPDFSAQEAEASFAKALNVARQQEAKSLELRAATSLARLWQQQGKTAEARDLLAPVYSWFTEGFDTKDLKDAKALLEELA